MPRSWQCATRKETSSQKFVRDHPDLKARVFETYSALIEHPEINAVFVYAYADARANQHRRSGSSEAGVCEKHISDDMNESEKLVTAGEEVAAGRSDGRILMIGQALMFSSEYAQIKRIVNYGPIGKPSIASLQGQHHAKGMVEDFADDELSGGVVIDLAIHDIDYRIWLLGGVSSVYAQGQNVLRRGGPHLIDYAQIHINFLSGAISYVSELGGP